MRQFRAGEGMHEFRCNSQNLTLRRPSPRLNVSDTRRNPSGHFQPLVC